MKTFREILIQVLTLLSLLIVVYTLSKIYLDIGIEHCLNIVVGEKDERYFYIDFIPQRDFTQYKLLGEFKQDSVTLITVEEIIRSIKDNNNDSIGLKIVCGDGLKYKTYINMLNLCLKVGISDWIPYSDTIFIFHKPEVKNIKKLGQNTSIPYPSIVY